MSPSLTRALLLTAIRVKKRSADMTVRVLGRGLWLIGGVLSVSGLLAQPPGRTDAWRLTPQGLQAPGSDTITPESRAARDAFFDSVLGSRPKGGGSVWESVGPEGEIPFGAMSTLVARFTGYTTIWSHSHKSLYTEVTMDVEEVVRDPSGAVQLGQPVTVILAGGSLKLPSGQILRRDLDQFRHYGIQPGHKYLMFVSYHSNGAFFVYDKSWELTNGVAEPNTADDAARAKRGESRFAGLPEDTFIAAVRTELAAAGPYNGK